MKVLVVGASGYLGGEIYHQLQDNQDVTVYGTCHKTNSNDLIRANLLNESDIERLITLQPDVIIWSICDFEEERHLSQIGINRMVSNISKDVRFIYVSTTIGKGKNQSEDIAPNLRTSDEYLHTYVNGKIEGEQLVSLHPNYVVVRPGSIYGFGYNGNVDLRMKVLLEKSATGENYFRTANMFSSFVHVGDLAKAIIELAYNDFIGIINISADAPISHYHFNFHLAKLMNIDNKFISADYKQEPVYHNLCNNTRKQCLNTSIREIEL